MFNPTAHDYYVTQDLAFQAVDDEGYELGCFNVDLRETIEAGMMRVVTVKDVKLTAALLPKVSKWRLIPTQGRFPHGLPEDHD